jgi:hypothetical protein
MLGWGLRFFLKIAFMKLHNTQSKVRVFGRKKIHAMKLHNT